MNRLSIIIPVYNGEKYLDETLKSLVEQSVDTFDVVIVDDGSTDGSAEIAGRYCDEYVGFYYYKTEHAGVYAARNFGVKHSEGEWLLFLDCGDMLSVGSAEALLECIEERGKPDIITGRNWCFGDVEYYYEESLDVLAVIPEIDKYESSVLRSRTLGCRAFRRTVFELWGCRFREELPAYDEYFLIVSNVLDGAKMCGCPGLILESRRNPVTDGLSRFEEPTSENLRALNRVLDELLAMAQEHLARDTGSPDLDQLYCQELIYSFFETVFDDFYRRFWFMDEDTLRLMKDILDKYAPAQHADRFKKIQTRNPDLGLPAVFVNRKDAAEHPAISVMLSLKDPSSTETMVASLYAQTFPFFELLLPQRMYDLLSDKYRNMENIRVFPDRSFHFDARRAARSPRCVNISSGKPLDGRVLSQTVQSRVPAAFIQYVFSQKRGTLYARKDMKDKGFVFPSQLGREEK